MMEAEVESRVQLRANKKTQRICNAKADGHKPFRRANEIAVRARGFAGSAGHRTRGKVLEKSFRRRIVKGKERRAHEGCLGSRRRRRT